MADAIVELAHQVMKHVPMVTWVGLCIAAPLGLVYLVKRYKEAALLGGVCAAYAVTPYLHF